MKTAIIYYSYDGNCALVAEAIKAALNADIFEIKTVDAKKRTGFAKYFLGGAQVIFGKKPALKPFAADIKTYDLIILGTPVWAGSPAPAMVSFLEKSKPDGKKIALFCCYNGGMGKVFDKLKALLHGNTIIAETGFIKPAARNPSGLNNEITEWVKSITV